jgi:hypothetical protein
MSGAFIYLGILFLLVALVIGLVIYARKQNQPGGGAALAGASGESFEVVARATEDLVDVYDIEGPFFRNTGGDAVAILELSPILVTIEGQRPELFQKTFAEVVGLLPENTTLQIVSMPTPEPRIAGLAETYAYHAYRWREQALTQGAAGQPDAAVHSMVRAGLALDIGKLILERGREPTQRTSLVVLTKRPSLIGPADAPLSEGFIREFELEVTRLCTLFNEKGLPLRPLEHFEALHYLWYAYNPTHVSGAVRDLALNRLADIFAAGRTNAQPVAALTSQEIQAALGEPRKHLKNVLAPRLLEEGNSTVMFENQTMLLYYITDFRNSDLMLTQELLGPDLRYLNRLFVTYFLNSPSVAEMARLSRKAETAKKAGRIMAERLGVTPSFQQDEEIFALSERRYSAETNRNPTRFVGMYVGLLVNSAAAEDERATFEGIMMKQGLRFVEARWVATEVWRSMAPTGVRLHRSGDDRDISSADATFLNPLSAVTVLDPHGDFIGYTEVGAGMEYPVAFNRERGQSPISRSEAYIGTTGQGKSFALKVMVADWHARGHNVAIIDPSSSREFSRLTDLLMGERVDLSGGEGFNPIRFEPFPPSVTGDDALLKDLALLVYEGNLAVVETLYATAKGDNATLSGAERGMIENAMRRAMDRKGMKHLDPSTWGNGIITLEDIYEEVGQDGVHKYPVEADLFIKNLRMYASRGELYYDQYNTHNTFASENPLVTFEFGLASSSENRQRLALMHLTTLRMVLQRAFLRYLLDPEPVPYHIVIDEASQMLVHPSITSYVTRIISEYAKYGFSVHLAFQDMNALYAVDAAGVRDAHTYSVNKLLSVIHGYFVFQSENKSNEAVVRALGLEPRTLLALNRLRDKRCMAIFPRLKLQLVLKMVAPESMMSTLDTTPEAMRQNILVGAAAQTVIAIPVPEGRR